MSEATAEARKRMVGAERAKLAVSRLLNSHFGDKDRGRMTIPVDVDDDDVVLYDYIAQTEAQLQQLQSGQAPGPWGQRGHLMLHCAKCDECNGTGRTDNHVSGEIECSSCEGGGLNCVLCERQAKLLALATEMRAEVENGSTGILHEAATNHWADQIEAIMGARAAAAIAEETK